MNQQINKKTEGLRALARMIAAAYRRRYAATGGKKAEAAEKSNPGGSD